MSRVHHVTLVRLGPRLFLSENRENQGSIAVAKVTRFEWFAARNKQGIDGECVTW